MKRNQLFVILCSACLLVLSCGNNKEPVSIPDNTRQDGTSDSTGNDEASSDEHTDSTDAECNNGILIDGKCQCYMNFSGENCNDCTSDFWGPNCYPCPNCYNGSKCNDGINGDGSCTCVGNWTDDRCLTCNGCIDGVGNCVTCPCGEHSDYQVEDGQPGIKCLCHPGWEGEACEHCDAYSFGPDCQPCQCGVYPCDSGLEGDGHCFCPEPWTGYGCFDCIDGYYGSNCTACPDCGAHGSCAGGSSGDGHCQCEDGWGGDDCNTLLKSLNESCQSDNECLAGLVCDYTLKTCQKACVVGENDCQNGLGCVQGHCTACPDHFIGPNCSECEAGYYGPKCRSCNCNTHRGICRDGRDGDGKCEPGSCEFGYTGDFCDECVEGFTGWDCASCAPNYFGETCQPCNCADNQSCVDGKNGTGACACKDGLTTTMKDGNDTYSAICINKLYWTQTNIHKQAGVTCYANPKNSNFVNEYGCLYTFEDAKKVCPAGWRLPKKDEYKEQLVQYVWENEGKDNIYQSLMAKSKAWGDLLNYITDAYGFSALPAGFYVHEHKNDGIDVYDKDAEWVNYGSGAYFWLLSPEKENTPVCGYVTDSMNNGQSVMWYYNDDVIAHSVRCVKDGVESSF